jgi:HK97 gp10 family phage protein
MTMSVRGTAELVRKLQTLRGKDGKAVMRKGCRAGAKVMAAAIRDALPSKSGAARRSVKVRSIKRSRKKVGVKVVVDARNAQGTPYSQFGEYGTKREQAKGWQHGAVRGEGASALERATEVMRDGIEALAKG